MKKCKKCGWENADSLSICEKCYGLLDDEKSGETAEKFFAKLERREKIKAIINYSLIVIYFIIVAPLYVITVKEIGSLGVALVLFFFYLLMPIFFYTSIFHPDTLFELSYTHIISNIHDAQPSDWFYTTTTWSAYIFLGLGIFMAVKLYLEVI